MQSGMIDLGSPAPDFVLTDPTGGVWELGKIAKPDQPVLVAFFCNHCPYVKHIADSFSSFASEYRDKGLAVVAISSNDISSHPEDAPDRMARFAQDHHFSFPYLYDEPQDAARDYGATCTPDFFLFDRAHKLAYRGQFDDTRPGKGAPNGADLRAAADAVLAGVAPNPEQKPSTGCSIKWKPGRGPS